MKRKITEAGQPCRHCGKPVVLKQHKAGWQPKPGRVHFRWWFQCEDCRAIYMVEAAKAQPEEAQGTPDLFTESPEQFANNLYEKNDRNLEN